MKTADFLQKLVLDNWSFEVADGRLKYRAPKASVSPSVLEKLRHHKQDIIHLLEKHPETIEVSPLSYGQRALWFLWKLSPESTAYNQSFSIRIPENGKNGDWCKAARLLTDRHPVLRTRFLYMDGEPIQQVTNPELDWKTTDAAGWTGSRLAAALATAHEAPFDLENRPLIRFRWFQAKIENLLLITMHHIVCDGWSIEIIRKELAWFHRQITNEKHNGNGGTELPPIRISYFDYVRWQLNMLKSSEGERLWNFWKKQLSPPSPVLSLPADYPRPAVQTYRGASCTFDLDETLHKRITAAAHGEGVTLYTFFLAAFFVLLHRYTGQKDISIGCMVVGRNRTEFSPITGYFINPVVTRAVFQDGQRFKSFLADIKKVSAEALEHSDFPFALLVEKLNIQREPDRSPLFDVTFNYLSRRGVREDTDQKSNNIRDNRQDDIPQADGKFDMTLTILEEKSFIKGKFGYNSDLFRKETVERISERFQMLLKAVTDNLNRETGRIPLDPVSVGKSANGILIPALRGDRLDLTGKKFLHHRIEEHARNAGAAIAIKSGESAISYSELNMRANGLASRLQEHGISTDIPVAIYTGDSILFAISMLAVLKSGGTYVPLDADHPKELIEYMIGAAGVRVILAEQRLANLLARLDIPVIRPDDETLHDADTNTTPNTPADLDALAYIIFTSGSTGKPKGVAIQHRALLNYLYSIMSNLNIEPSRNFAVVSTVSADLGNTMIFSALCSGGCLHVLPAEDRLDKDAFADFIKSCNIDYLKIVPSHLKALADTRNPEDSLPQKALILGGESSSSHWVRSLRNAAPQCRFYNHYGPTEATVGVLTYEFTEKEFSRLPATLPLRKPVANTEIFLLDPYLEPIPPGLIGELYIGGDSLAKCYINDPRRTAESFIESPVYGGKLYGTGDLARQLPDGDLEILGRKDRQINLRGHRIELEQIESTLMKHRQVHQCAVLPDKDGNRAGHLLAFVIPGPGTNGDMEAGKQFKRRLKKYLEERLPRIMVPGSFLLVKEIPLTPNGKLDSTTLRQKNTTNPEAARYTLPRDLIELRLSRIWAEVLDVPAPSIHDDFFEAGGHSLLAVRLLGTVSEEFHRPLPPSILLTHPTIEKMADYLRSSQSETDYSILVPMQPKGDRPNLFCLPGAGGSILYFSPLAHCLGNNRPVWGLQALGLNPDRPLPERIEDIASHYVETIRTKVQPKGPYYLAGHSFGAFVALEMAQLFLETGEEVRFLGVIDNAAPSDSPPVSYTNWDFGKWLMHVSVRMGKLFDVDLKLREEHLNALPRSEQIDYMIESMIDAQLIPAEMKKAHFVRFIELYKANATAAALYYPKTRPVSAKLTLFCARDHDAMLGPAASTEQPDLGWQAFSREPVEVIKVPGTHLTMMNRPHVHVLANKINECLERS